MSSARPQFRTFPHDGSDRERVEWIGQSSADFVLLMLEEHPEWRPLVAAAERSGGRRMQVLQACA